MEKKSKGTYWAYIIVGAIAINICAAIYTVVLSTDYPLDYDESYFQPYQQVENDFVNIQAAQDAFNKRFKLKAQGAKRTHLPITKRPALLLTPQDSIYIEVLGNEARDLKVDARIKQPQDVTPARKIELARQDVQENGTQMMKLSLNASELKPGRNTLMLYLKLPKHSNTQSDKLRPQQRLHPDLIEPSRFVRLELCLERCSAADAKEPNLAKL